MRSSRTPGWLVLVLSASIGLACWLQPPCLWAQAIPAAEIDEETARQRQIIDRFMTVLEKNPRRGTALDRIYGFHIENGTIEAFVQDLRNRVEAKPDDGTGWMVLGLVESQRGRDAAAVTALTKAKDLRQTDALAAYYLGQALVLVGQPDPAVAAFEEAIQRKPNQADLLEIFQALGRVHQRAQRTAEALAVWSRLEQLFPNDARVQEQIAVTLVEEGQAAEALPRYETLAKNTTDDYRRTVYLMDAAELKIKLNRASDGISDLENLLAKLNPDSWLFREVRRKIEEVFLRSGDQDGLATYYTRWLAKSPEDIEAMGRLARVLARQSRVPEAQQWLDKALKLAPSRKELRLAFIEQLLDDQRYAEAIQQYEALDKADPNNPDYLRDWGKLILRDAAKPRPERQAEAEKVWRRLLTARPNDALIATQVADLFRHAELQDQALELYQMAVELAPAQPQYREYLGEYYHILKRPEEAVAAWRKMAEGKERTATNVARLAEVFAQFGYIEHALPEIAAACELDPKDYSLQLKAAELQLRGEAFELALASLARAEALSQNDEEREAVLAQQIRTYTLQDRLERLATELTREASGDMATHGKWFLLARYREALREFPEAKRAIGEALKLEPNDIRSLAAAARIAEQSGDLEEAANLNRKLAVVDRRGRSEYLQQVARLETQLGRIDEALAAGRELIAAAPGNVETYQFFADMCFRLNRTDDGLTALRRATRVNPNEPALLLSLAAALAAQFRTDEAIELYWQTLEKQPQLDDKLSVISRLADLYLQLNHFDQLLERLQRGQREPDRRREMTICLAQAYQSAGDFGMARQELERLLSENTRDTQLLLQLSKLAEGESDIPSAVKYQEQLAKLAPSPEVEYRLSTLLSRAGDNQAAADILVRLTSKEDDKEKLLRNIDGLLTAEQHDMALAVLEPKLRENASDWELLYREGLALAKRRPDEAPRRFQAILDLTRSDDELGIVAKNRQAKARSQPATLVASSVTGMNPAAAMIRTRPLRTDYAFEVRRAVGLDPELNYAPSMTRRPPWLPQDFGQARLAAIGWLFAFAQKQNQTDTFVTAHKARAESATAGPRELWDWVYLQAMRADDDALLPACRRLAEKGGPNEKLLYLMKLAARGGELNINAPTAALDKDDKTPPLEADELAFVLRIYDDIRKAPADPQSMIASYTRSSALAVFKELARAGRKDDEQRLYRDSLDKATTLEELGSALHLALQRRDHSAFLTVFDRYAAKDLQTADNRGTASAGPTSTAGEPIARFIGQSDPPLAEIPAALDRFLTYHAAKSNQRRSRPGYRPANRSLAMRQTNYVYVWSGNNQRYTQLTYPAPGEYFDQPALGVLRTAFELYHAKDLSSDLIKHLEQSFAQAAAAQKLYAALALAYVQVWNEDRETAAQTLAQAASLAPQDLDLRLEAARLHIEMGQFDDALAIVEAVAPLDQRTMQQRETLALDLAVRLGDHQRAREAAQRLFGLRLDPETQVALAGQMRRLGMNEESEAVLSRAQRQAGSRLSALSILMAQYQAQGQMDVAAQVAHQILRRSRTAPASQTAMGFSTADSQARQSALRCLAQAGKLKELIANLEQQVERTPQASQLYETLSEYYQAAGDNEKLLAMQAKIVALRPDDAELRYRYGQELSRRGKMSEACDEYLVVVRWAPQLLRNRYWEVQQAFQRARREADLVRVLGEIDLKSFGQSYIVTNIISNMMRDQRSRATTMVLFKKAWEAFPDQRANMMNSFYDPQVWKTPEILEFGRQSLIPTAAALRNDPWYGLYAGLSLEGDGRISAVLNRVLDAYAGTNRLAKLREDIAATITQFPRWLAGPVMLTVIDLRMGKQIDAAAELRPMLTASARDNYQLRYGRWIIGQELEAHAATKDLAIQLYERATVSDEQDLNDQFQFSPAPRLVHLYKEAGRLEDARKVLMRAALKQPVRDNNYPYRLSQKAENLVFIGKSLLDMDQPVDAMRAYRELLTNPDFGDPQMSAYSGRTTDQWRSQARRGVELAMKKLAQRPTADHVQAFVVSAEKRQPATGVLDLMVAATPNEQSPLPLLESPLVGLIRAAEKDPAAIASIESQLAPLAGEHPQDMAVAIAQSLLALKGKDSTKADQALERLRALAEATPLEEVPSGKRANSRQRSAAVPQIGLWLVARECLGDSSRASMGQTLAARAVAAAQRQLDPAELTAMMYERGKLALAAGDRAAAESAWNELLELSLVKPRQARPAAVVPASATAPRAPVVSRDAKAPASAAAAPRAGKMPATLSQFKLGASISQAAAESDLPELSLRAIREALAGGIPVADLPRAGVDPFGAPARVRVVTPGASSRTDIDDTVFSELATRLWQLSLVWKQRSFPAAEVCTLLESIVFPADRPGEILIYEQPVTNDISNPRSVGRLLADWTLSAGRSAEIQREIAARQASPTDVVGGKVLLVQLAVAAGQRDAARQELAGIAELLESSKLPTLSNLALHAAAAAYGDSELMPAGVPLLEKVIATPPPLGRSVSFGAPGPHAPATVLVREHLRAGQAEAAQTQIERFLQTRQEIYARFGGDSSLRQQKLDLLWMATELSRAGDLAATLEPLGRAVDVTFENEIYGNQPMTTGVALWYLARNADKLPADKRYEVLRAWSLPTEKRRTLRIVAGFDAGQPIPPEFLAEKQATSTNTRIEPSRGPVSNLTLLVDAATQAGKLAELAAAIEPLATEKIPGSEALQTLVLLAQGDHDSAAPRLDAIVKRIRASRSQTSNDDDVPQQRQPRVEWDDYLVAHVALAKPELAAAAARLGQFLLNRARASNQIEMVQHLADAIAQSKIAALAPAESKLLTAASLVHWTEGGSPSPLADVEPLPLWAVNAGHLVRHGSRGAGSLVFNRPLEGEFEVTFDAMSSPESRFGLGYGGISVGPSNTGGPITVSSAGLGVQVNRPPAVEFGSGWNHVRIHVTPAKVRFYLNDRQTYEDSSPSRTSPWLVLNAFGTWPAVKNLHLTGTPTVPSTVSLVGADRLDGWNASFYSEQVPGRLKRTEADDESELIEPRYVMNPFGEYVLFDPSARVTFDWHAAGGILEGRADQAAAPFQQSRLYYHRPLQDGERLTYQFLYEPGKTHVSPTLGRIAYLLQPEGLRLHWMTPTNDATEPLLVNAANEIAVSDIKKLALKENNWNDVELAIRGDKLHVSLNGSEIYDCPIEPSCDRRFGFFHFKSQTAVKVRSVVLHGNWAAEPRVSNTADLLALKPASTTDSLTRARHALVGEKVLTTAAYDVWLAAQAMSPEKRYEYLKEWVLPSRDHLTVRLAVDWTPTDPIQTVPRAERLGSTSPGASQPPGHVGGELVSPALALVASAKQLGKLDDLATAIAIAAKEHPEQVRALISLQVLLALARDDEQSAQVGLKQAFAFIKSQLVETPLHERYAEFLAAYAALEFPAARAAARALAVEIVRDNQARPNLGDPWARRASHLRSRANWATDKATANLPFGYSERLSQWHAVTRSTARERGLGFPAGGWRLTSGQATFHTGGPGSSLYHSVPLTGDFEVRAQITTAGSRTVRLLYGGIAVGITPDAKQAIRQEVGRSTDTRTPLTEKPTGWGPTVELKLVVKDSTLTASINEMQIHTEPLPASVDPWLAISSPSQNHTGMVKNLQITGSPSVPAQIDLSPGKALDGWRADYYGEHAANGSSTWVKKDGAITAEKIINADSTYRESLLQYHRPLLEDGELEYEFFYEPGKHEVHPALDRLAFLLAPEGVRTHWLTDAQFERTELAPDNATPLPGARPVPLKLADWNQLKLVLQGDDVRIVVNGTDVGSHRLTATNQRTFGLFRFADAAGARVRNPKYRGHWPTKPFAVNEQQLAATSDVSNP
jgi:tetratricopeptide (TPR) repeat protein